MDTEKGIEKSRCRGELPNITDPGIAGIVAFRFTLANTAPRRKYCAVHSVENREFVVTNVVAKGRVGCPEGHPKEIHQDDHLEEK